MTETACRQWRRGESGRFRPSISEFRKFPILEQQRIAEKSLANASRKAELEAECERQRRERYGPKVA